MVMSVAAGPGKELSNSHTHHVTKIMTAKVSVINKKHLEEIAIHDCIFLLVKARVVTLLSSQPCEKQQALFLVYKLN